MLVVFMSWIKAGSRSLLFQNVKIAKIPSQDKKHAETYVKLTPVLCLAYY